MFYGSRITIDLSNSINLTVCSYFPKDNRTIVTCDALQKMKIAHRWNTIQEETNNMKEARYFEKRVHSF